MDFFSPPINDAHALIRSHFYRPFVARDGRGRYEGTHQEAHGEADEEAKGLPPLDWIFHQSVDHLCRSTVGRERACVIQVNGKSVDARKRVVARYTILTTGTSSPWRDRQHLDMIISLSQKNNNLKGGEGKTKKRLSP